MKWKLFDHLLVMIVTEKFSALNDENIDNVIGCVGTDQRHVAEKIIEAHNATVEALSSPLQRIISTWHDPNLDSSETAAEMATIAQQALGETHEDTGGDKQGKEEDSQQTYEGGEES